MIELQHIGIKEECSLSKAAKDLRERDAQIRSRQTANSSIKDTMEGGADGMDVPRSLFRRHTLFKNCEPDLVDIDLVNEQSVYSWVKKLSILALKDLQSK